MGAPNVQVSRALTKPSHAPDTSKLTRGGAVKGDSDCIKRDFSVSGVVLPVCNDVIGAPNYPSP